MADKTSIKAIKIEELKGYPGNPRNISDTMKERLKKSLLEFGIVEPLVVNMKNEVIGGNQRLLALKELIEEKRFIIDKVECIVVDLPKDKEKALNLALNKISGTWDEELLKSFISDLDFEALDIDITGFDDAELKEILLEKEQGEIDPYEEWGGMPKFEQEDIGSFRKVIVHFKDKEDAESFFSILGVNDTGKTAYFWWPPQENRDTESYRWKEKESDIEEPQ